MKAPGTLAATLLAARIASVRPRLRAAFLLALASLLVGGARLDASPDPVFIDWPSAITNVWQSSQITYTNSTYPNGLAVSNVNGAADVTIISGTKRVLYGAVWNELTDADQYPNGVKPIPVWNNAVGNWIERTVRRPF